MKSIPSPSPLSPINNNNNNNNNRFNRRFKEDNQEYYLLPLFYHSEYRGFNISTQIYFFFLISNYKMAQLGPTTLETPVQQVSLYPSHMAYYSKRINGFSKNTVRLNTQSTNSVNSNGIVSLTLPTNSIVDLKSLGMFFEIDIDSAGGAADNAIFPRFTTSLMERVQVSVGGVAVGNAPNMNSAIAYLKQIATMSPDKADSQPHLWCSPQGYTNEAVAVQNRRGCLGGAGARPNWQNGIQQRTPYDTNKDATVTNNVLPAAGGISTSGNFIENDQYCIELFNGFVSESSPAYLDTSALGAIRLDILLSPASVFVGTDGAAAPAAQAAATVNDYTLKKIYALVDVISIADGIYNASLASYLQSGNSLKIPFNNYFVFSDNITSFNSSLRVNVRSQNIRRVWNAWRRANYNAAGATWGAAMAVDAFSNANTTPYFQFNGGNPAAAGNFPSSCLQSLQLQVNNVQVPAQPMESMGVIQHYNRKALNKMNNQLGSGLADIFVDRQNCSDMLYSVLALDDRMSNGLRTLSGYNSAGTQTSIYVNLTQTATALATNQQHFCCVECTSLLLVGQNRQITVIS